MKLLPFQGRRRQESPGPIWGLPRAIDLRGIGTLQQHGPILGFLCLRHQGASGLEEREKGSRLGSVGAFVVVRRPPVRFGSQQGVHHRQARRTRLYRYLNGVGVDRALLDERTIWLEMRSVEDGRRGGWQNVWKIFGQD